MTRVETHNRAPSIDQLHFFPRGKSNRKLPQKAEQSKYVMLQASVSDFGRQAEAIQPREQQSFSLSPHSPRGLGAPETRQGVGGQAPVTGVMGLRRVARMWRGRRLDRAVASRCPRPWGPRPHLLGGPRLQGGGRPLAYRIPATSFPEVRLLSGSHAARARQRHVTARAGART